MKRVLGVVAVFAACSGEPSNIKSIALETDETFHTFITDNIQIDQDGAGPGDANLTVGLETDFDLPPAEGTFIDWTDLDPLDHRLTDLSSASGKDVTAFPGSNECVGTANVLSKMDLTYVGVANNNEYAYLAVQRSANNGDAGYYWLFTKAEPSMELGAGPCKAQHGRLMYTIRAGDVLVGGHFQPSAEPLLTAYRAAEGTDVVLTAVDAIDFTNPIWEEAADAVAAVAVNTTPTDPGSWGAEGIKTMDGTNLGTELVAEAGLDLSLFTGEGSNCGATYYGSVITRSSGAGGTTPDLKDLAGPAKFVFGEVAATAELRPTCDMMVEYEVTSATGTDGEPTDDIECIWTFSDGTQISDCSPGSHTFAESGTVGATVVVTESGSSCSVEIIPNEVEAYPSVGVEIDLDPTCESKFLYDSTVTGGKGVLTYAWDFSTGDTSSDASGEILSGAGDFSASLSVTDERGCQGSDADNVFALAPLGINIAPSADGGECIDTATYTASVSGGSGNYEITWSGDVSCAPGTSCLIDPSDSMLCGELGLQAHVSDDSGLCPGADSEVETYEKVTTITLSNN